MPGGSAGRRQRPATPETPSRAGGNGGASLFTPAYRVSHAAAGTRPTSRDHVESGAAGPDAPSPSGSGYGYGRSAAGQAPSPYSWAEADSDQASVGYQQSGYASLGDPDWPGESGQSGGYSWAADDWSGTGAPWSSAGRAGRLTEPQVSNAVRGFPPAPGDPLPVYPPGPFSAWNRGPADRLRGQRTASSRAGSPGAGRAPTASGPSRQFAAATITPDEFDTDYSLPAIKDPVPRSGGKSGSGQVRAGRPPVTPAKGRMPAAPVRPASPGKSKGKGNGKGKAAASPRGRRQPAWLAIGAAAVIVAAVAVILVITSPGSGLGKNPTAGTSPRQVVPSPTVPPGLWGYIGTRSTDQQPLSTQELFPASFSTAGAVYTEVKEGKTHNCDSALIGSAIQAAVKAGHCTQAVRATYVSQIAGVMATVGVFNLKDSASASKAASKAGRSEFVAQLAPKAGPARKIGQGTGIEEALLKGHYDVLVWAEFTNLHAPKTRADRARLDSFMKTLLSMTANHSLSYRQAFGKPLVRA